MRIHVYQDNTLYADMGLDPNVQQHLKIGRMPTADLRLNHPSIARLHAVLDWNGQHFILSDLLSRNTIKLGDHILTRHALQEGDVIDLGSFTLHVMPEPRESKPVVNKQEPITQATKNISDTPIVSSNNEPTAITYAPSLEESLAAVRTSLFDLFFDRTLAGTSTFSLVVHGTFIAFLLLFPYNAMSLQHDLFQEPNRFATLLLKPHTASFKPPRLPSMVQHHTHTPQKTTPKKSVEKINTPGATGPKALNPEPNAPSPEPTLNDLEQELDQHIGKALSNVGSLPGRGKGGSMQGNIANVIATRGASDTQLMGIQAPGDAPLIGGGAWCLTRRFGLGR